MDAEVSVGGRHAVAVAVLALVASAKRQSHFVAFCRMWIAVRRGRDGVGCGNVGYASPHFVSYRQPLSDKTSFIVYNPGGLSWIQAAASRAPLAKVSRE